MTEVIAASQMATPALDTKVVLIACPATDDLVPTGVHVADLAQLNRETSWRRAQVAAESIAGAPWRPCWQHSRSRRGRTARAHPNSAHWLLTPGAWPWFSWSTMTTTCSTCTSPC